MISRQKYFHVQYLEYDAPLRLSMCPLCGVMKRVYILYAPKWAREKFEGPGGGGILYILFPGTN